MILVRGLRDTLVGSDQATISLAAQRITERYVYYVYIHIYNTFNLDLTINKYHKYLRASVKSPRILSNEIWLHRNSRIIFYNALLD